MPPVGDGRECNRLTDPLRSASHQSDLLLEFGHPRPFDIQPANTSSEGKTATLAVWFGLSRPAGKRTFLRSDGVAECRVPGAEWM